MWYLGVGEGGGVGAGEGDIGGGTVVVVFAGMECTERDWRDELVGEMDWQGAGGGGEGGSMQMEEGWAKASAVWMFVWAVSNVGTCEGLRGPG